MRVFDSALLTIFAQLVSLAVSFCVSLLVSRLLGPDGKGVFSLVLYTATILFGICNLGLGFASQYFISREPSSFRTQFTNVLLFPLALSLAVGAAFLASFPIWKPYLQGLSLRDLLPALSMLPCMLLFESCCQLLVVRGRIAHRSIVIVVQSGIVLVLATGLLLAGASSVIVSLAYAAGWAVGGALAFFYVIRSDGFPGRPSLPLLRQTLRYSLWIYGANLIKELYLRIDFLFLYAQRTTAEAGVYSVAAALTSGMTAIMLAIQTVFYPRTSADSDSEARQTTPLFYRQTMIAMALAGIGMALLSYPLLLVFGPSFVVGLIPMLILIVGTAIKGGNAILYTHLLGRGKAYVMVLVTVITLLSSTVLNATLVARLGMVGAASATLGAFIVESVVLILLYRRLTHGNVATLFAYTKDDVRLLAGETRSLISRLIRRARQSQDAT